MNISRLSLICAAIAADATTLSNEGISHPSSTASTRNLQNGDDDIAYYCACKSCTQEIWDSIAVNADGQCESCTCGSRITYLQTSQGFDAAGACAQVSDVFIDGPCGPVCDPTKCEGGLTSQFLNKPATSLDTDPSNKLVNIALGKMSTASTQIGSASNAFDGNPKTRWESVHGIDNKWLQVDLGAMYQLSKVAINWETASAKSYDIQVWTDGSFWTSVWSKTDGFEGMGLVESDFFGVVIGRYVRMQAYERTTRWGYSIWEMEVFGQRLDSGTSLPPQWTPTISDPINIANGKSTSASDGSEVQSAFYATDGNPMTRWECPDGLEDVWLQVDLGAVYHLAAVAIHWETASAKSYDIQVSTDGSFFNTVWSKTDGFEGMGLVESVFSGLVTGRYVRMVPHEQATEWGYSIWEMTVLENSDSALSVPLESSPIIVPNPINIASSKVSTASSQDQSSAYAFDGSPLTRWESAHGIDNVWLQVDLGAMYQLSKVTINWENASAKTYAIQVSNYGSSFRTVWIKRDGFKGMGVVGSIFGVVNSRGIVDDVFGVVTGRYVRMQAYERATMWGYSIWEMEVFGEKITTPALTENLGSGTFAPTQSSLSLPDPVNIAYGKVSTASSQVGSAAFTFHAFDGSLRTRWESAHGIEDEWLQVDLGAMYQLSTVVIYWENSSAKSYAIQVSTDGLSFRTVWSKTDGFEGMGTVESIFGVVTGRYVRMQAYERATMWGYSIWEMEVFGQKTAAPPKSLVPAVNPVHNAEEPTKNPTRYPTMRDEMVDETVEISKEKPEVNRLVVVQVVVSLLLIGLLLVVVVAIFKISKSRQDNR